MLPTRLLALVIAAAFAVAPLVIWLMLPSGEDRSWQMGVIAAVYLLGAGLLATGAVRWYGKGARRLRVWGFVLLLAGALANVSFAFALVPLVLLAALSLRHHDPRADHNTVAGTRVKS